MPNITFAKKDNTSYASELREHKILIVDDDQSVHDVTNMALKSMQFLDFKLKVLCAYSAKEAIEILRKESDIALALIDVVMETPEAGLDLVDYIRGTLDNKLIRLIIRTGQANDFPQMKVIQRYDINDFKEKTELTLERLYTTVRSSIKQFEQLLDLENKLEETYLQMTTNPLTLLPNRTKLIEDFANKSHQTLILIDIVCFSIINETNGYDIGDIVLKEIGGFLSSMYSNKFNVYHLNADVFALVTTQESYEDLIATVEEIKQDISRLNIATGNFHKSVETTIGVAYQSEDDVMKKAELALKEARNTGKNQIKFYSNDLKIIQEISNTNHWAPIIKSALNDKRIVAYAQPIYNIFDNTVDKYELLVRLIHEGTVYSPLNFLSAANNSGQLYNIFKYMFNEGCRLAAKTGNSYSINISSSELGTEGLVAFVQKTLKKHKVNPELISLEILESSAITQSEEMKQLVVDLHSTGLEFVIDDFGIQCSNFSQTEFLPVTTLKIDGSFVKNLHECKNSQIVVKTIQTFAQGMGLKLIAEFVCSKEVYDTVKEFGIQYAQGYYLGEPKATQE